MPAHPIADTPVEGDDTPNPFSYDDDATRAAIDKHMADQTDAPDDVQLSDGSTRPLGGCRTGDKATT